MKFFYLNLPAKPTPAYPDKKSELYPIIPIRFKNNSHFCDCYALIDSGATDCLFPAFVGEKIGLEIKDGKLQTIYGVGQSVITAYFHNVTFELGGREYQSYFGFTYDALPFPALGQRGFFNLFRVKFVYSKGIIEIIPEQI